MNSRIGQSPLKTIEGENHTLQIQKELFPDGEAKIKERDIGGTKNTIGLEHTR